MADEKVTDDANTDIDIFLLKRFPQEALQDGMAKSGYGKFGPEAQAAQRLMQEVQSGAGISPQDRSAIIDTLNDPAKRKTALDELGSWIDADPHVLEKLTAKDLMKLVPASPPVNPAPVQAPQPASTPATSSATPPSTSQPTVNEPSAPPPAPIPLSDAARHKLALFGLQDVTGALDPASAAATAYFRTSEGELNSTQTWMDPVVRNRIVSRMNDDPAGFDEMLRTAKQQIADDPRIVQRAAANPDDMLKLFGMAPAPDLARMTPAQKAQQFVDDKVAPIVNRALTEGQAQQPDDGTIEGGVHIFQRYVINPRNARDYESDLTQAITRFESIQPTLAMARETLREDHAMDRKGDDSLKRQTQIFDQRVDQLRHAGVSDERTLAVQGYMAAALSASGQPVTEAAASDAIRRDEYRKRYGGLTQDQADDIRKADATLPGRNLGDLNRAINLDYLTGAGSPVITASKASAVPAYIPPPWDDGIDHRPGIPQPYQNGVQAAASSQAGASSPQPDSGQPAAATPRATPRQMADYYVGNIPDADIGSSKTTAAERDAYRATLNKAIVGLESVQITPAKLENILRQDGTGADLMKVYTDKVAALQKADPGATPAQQQDIAMQAYQAMIAKRDYLPNATADQNAFLAKMHADSAELSFRSRIYSQEGGGITAEQREQMAERRGLNPDSLKNVSIVDYLTTVGAPAGSRMTDYGFTRDDVLQNAASAKPQPSAAPAPATKPATAAPGSSPLSAADLVDLARRVLAAKTVDDIGKAAPGLLQASKPSAPLEEMKQDAQRVLFQLDPKYQGGFPPYSDSHQSPDYQAASNQQILAGSQAIAKATTQQQAQTAMAGLTTSLFLTSLGADPSRAQPIQPDALSPRAQQATLDALQKPANAILQSQSQSSGAPQNNDGGMTNLLAGWAGDLFGSQAAGLVHTLGSLDASGQQAASPPANGGTQTPAVTESKDDLISDIMQNVLKLSKNPDAQQIIAHAKSDPSYNDTIHSLTGLDLANQGNALQELQGETPEQLQKKKDALQKLLDNPDELALVAKSPQMVSSMGEIKQGWAGLMHGDFSGIEKMLEGFMGMIGNIHGLGDIGTLFKMAPDMLGAMNDGSPQQDGSNNGGQLAAQLFGPGNQSVTDVYGQTPAPTAPAPQGQTPPAGSQGNTPLPHAPGGTG